MSDLCIYSIFDRKALAFLTPYLCQNDAVALRMFEGAVMDRQTAMAQFPEDYVLYRCGMFATDDGRVVGQEPMVIGDAVSVLRNREPASLPLFQGGEGGRSPTSDASLSSDVAGTDDAPRGRTMSDTR